MGKSFVSMLLMASLNMSVATILADMEQGAKFDGCIAIEDWEGKTINDDITLEDRDAQGCCPTGTVPGVKHYSNYVGAQVVCGFKEDGTLEFTTSTSNGETTCTYNQCYIWKQNLACEEGTQRLNGCCAAAEDCETNACGFETDCKNYAYDIDNVHDEETKYCLTYHKNYKMEYTAETDDDQKDDKLQIDKVYQYTKCSGGNADGDGGDDDTPTGGTTTAATRTAAAASGAQWMTLNAVVALFVSHVALVSA